MKAKVKRRSVIALSIATIMLLTILAPVNVSAYIGNPYRDVTVTRTGKIPHDSIWELKSHNAYQGIIRGVNPRFYPGKVITKWEAIKTLQNYYGVKYVPISANDKNTFQKSTNYKWLYWKLSLISKRNHDIIWDTSYSEGAKLTRARLAVTLAAIRPPYAADVSPAKIGKERSDAINWVKAHKGYKGVITTKNFSPNKKVTKKELVKILTNLYGRENVLVWSSDIEYGDAETYYSDLYKKITYMELGRRLDEDSPRWKGRFDPDDLITRANLAVVLRDYGIQKNPRPKVFPKQ